MLIHLAPRLFLNHTTPCCLSDIYSLELGLSLRGGVDVDARKPYPNKRFLVACRKVGRKAVAGILIEAPSMQEFTVVTRWAISQRIVTHRVHYIVLDDENDAVSDSMVTWHPTGETHGNWSSRWPEPPSRDCCPATHQPRMDARMYDADRTGDIEDFHDKRGNLIERYEVFRMPTIERGRLLPSEIYLGNRAPLLEHAFAAGERA